jgi:hypothetical protein
MREIIYFCYLLLVPGIIFYLFCLHCKKSKESGDTTFFIFIIVLVSSLPLINDFTQYGHDVLFQLERIENIKDNLLSGNFPVRINYSGGKPGIATPIMYPELFLYIPAIMRILGLPLVFSTKIFNILINISCTLIAYYSAKQITKSNNIGLIFSGIYSLCIYRLEDIYLRFATGEALAMVFIPLVMLGIYHVLCDDEKKWPILVIGITGVLQSHLISFFLVSCFLLLFFLLCIKNLNKARIFSLIKSCILVLCLNMWFIIPLIVYYNIVDFPSKMDMYKSAVYPNQMFATFVKNSGLDLYGTGRTNGEMPLSLGGVIGIGLLFFIYVTYINISNENEKTILIDKAGKASLLLGSFSAFAASVFFPWFVLKQVPILNTMQFSWRFLSIAAPLLSLPASIGFYFLFKRLGFQDKFAVFIIVFITVAGSAYYIDTIIDTSTYLTWNMELGDARKSTIGFGDYRYKGTTWEEVMKNSGKIVYSPNINIINVSENKNGGYTVLFENSSTINDCSIELPIFNFPGYVAFFNNVKFPIENGQNNFIRLNLPNNIAKGVIKVYYKELNVFIFGNVISIIALIIFIIMCRYKSLFNKKAAR